MVRSANHYTTGGRFVSVKIFEEVNEEEEEYLAVFLNMVQDSQRKQAVKVKFEGRIIPVQGVCPGWRSMGEYGDYVVQKPGKDFAENWRLMHYAHIMLEVRITPRKPVIIRHDYSADDSADDSL
nr:hypothetical protein BaRGS_033359 [Batillaria attramentaria]